MIDLMTIKARLAGQSFDLQALAELFREGDPQIAGDDSGYCLTSMALDGLMNDVTRLGEIASSLLAQANGVARALDSGFRPVSHGGQFSDGSGLYLVAEAAQIDMRGQVRAVAMAANGEPQPPLPPRGPAYLRLATASADVADALRILGSQAVSFGWVELYKIFEIVRDSAGDEKSLKAKNWVESNDLDAFTMSANRHDVSGDQARHARSKGDPPRRTRAMNLDEARAMIGRLVVAWWDSIAASTR